MEMLDCLPNLTKLYLDDNYIRGLESMSYTRQSINLLSLANNKVASLPGLISPAKECLSNLKILKLGTY